MTTDTLLNFWIILFNEMRNSIIREDNWPVRSECVQSNGAFGGIFETQVNTKGEYTCLVAGRVKWRIGEKVEVRYQVWDEVVEKQMKRGKQCRKHNVQADKRTVKVRGKQ